MVAFGWSYDELEATRSDLTDSTQRHTNLQQLAHGMEGLTITQSLRYLDVEGGPGSLEEGIQEKRRCSDSDDADRPVKRVRPLHFEEPDISMMTGLSPMPGEQEMSTMMVLSPMPGEQSISTRMQMFEGLDIPIMQPAQTSGADISVMPHQQLITQYPQAYDNWASETLGWKETTWPNTSASGDANGNCQCSRGIRCPL